MREAIVQTAAGQLRGVRDDNGIARWLGIPYARARRGRLPEPVIPWAGTRDAMAFGPACPQPAGTDLIPGSALGAPTDEACHVLNVWSPTGTATHNEPLPVLVWIPGGAFLTGAASQAMFDGAALALRGVVVVSLNYRVGPFGFLAATPELTARGWPTNCGLHDAIAALRWLRAEIGAFGGDPANVTVFGESAGAGVIAHLLGAPGRSAWFERAIVQSASYDRTFDESTGALVTDALVKALGGIDALYDASAARLVDAVGKVMTDPAIFTAVGIMPFHPAIDGVVVLDSPARAAASGTHAGADLIVSVTRDEMCLFEGRASIERERLRTRVARYLSLDDNAANELITRYSVYLDRSGLPNEPIDVWVAIYSDREMAIPAREYVDAAAHHHDAVYAAYFDWSAPPRPDGRPVGAAHAIDIPFTFSTLDVDSWRTFLGATGDGATAADGLADAVGSAWTSFARAGDAGWPRWRAGHTVQGFGSTIRLLDDPTGRRAALWDGL